MSTFVPSLFLDPHSNNYKAIIIQIFHAIYRTKKKQSDVVKHFWHHSHNKLTPIEKFVVNCAKVCS